MSSFFLGHPVHCLHVYTYLHVHHIQMYDAHLVFKKLRLWARMHKTS